MQAASFRTSLCKCLCFRPAASLKNLDATSQSWLTQRVSQAIVVYVSCTLHSCQVGALLSALLLCDRPVAGVGATHVLIALVARVLLDLPCLRGAPLAHRVALHISVGAHTHGGSGQY